MHELRWLQLPKDELDDFLGDGGTGILSFSTPGDEPPITVPVSYGYFADAERFYFRLAITDESEKASVVDRPVSFVTFEETDEGWKSVVATGSLEEVDELPYESAVVQGLWAVQMPRVDIFERPRDEVPFVDFCLDPDNLTGRTEIVAHGRDGE
ncbi:pyridoxamine 5'-phosphate oxidase family protein [Natronobeatus ordinarius]|uniref:pyridoxamine 5'-phosphate oxidase family protein n=1 Tax=Natronobeatus ordinarius TaxID=2963433 RepID=UPI0020CCC2A6|nr:pyridoxamine 5'-phosphate oxidase family protein [Natronobeatus ordinarius]